MDRDGRWTKEDIPKLTEIKRDPKQVEKLKQEKRWCDPDLFKLLLKCSEKKEISDWNEFRRKNPDEQIWLQNTSLIQSNLEYANLNYSDMTFTDIRYSNLENATLISSNLENSNLVNANLRCVKLKYANLKNTNLKNANLIYSYLERTLLVGSDLENTEFCFARLQDANLNETNLENTSFDNAFLHGCSLIKANARGTNFNNSQIGVKIFGTKPSSPEQFDIQKNHLICETTNFTDTEYNSKDRFISWRFHVFAWFLICKLSHIMKYPKPNKNHYKQTTFIGVDTTKVDWSKNPQLKRDIHNQQYLYDMRSSIQSKPFLLRIPQKFLYFLWGLTSDHGDNIWLWLFWSGVFAVLFAGLFSGWFTFEKGICEEPKLHYQTHDLLYEKETGKSNPDIAEPDFSESLYYSVVTFTTLGFGDVIPVNASGRWAVMFEVILGYIMLGGLISLFANKFVRRE